MIESVHNISISWIKSFKGGIARGLGLLALNSCLPEAISKKKTIEPQPSRTPLSVGQLRSNPLIINFIAFSKTSKLSHYPSPTTTQSGLVSLISYVEPLGFWLAKNRVVDTAHIKICSISTLTIVFGIYRVSAFECDQPRWKYYQLKSHSKNVKRCRFFCKFLVGVYWKSPLNWGNPGPHTLSVVHRQSGR